MNTILILEKDDATYKRIEKAMEVLKDQVVIQRYQMAKVMIDDLYGKNKLALLMILEDQYIHPSIPLPTTKEAREQELFVDVKQFPPVSESIDRFKIHQFETPVILHDCSNGRMRFSSPMPTMRPFCEESPDWIEQLLPSYVKWLLERKKKTSQRP